VLLVGLAVAILAAGGTYGGLRLAGSANGPPKKAASNAAASSTTTTTTIPSGTFNFTTPDGLSMSVTYSGTVSPDCAIAASDEAAATFASGCSTARTDNLVGFKFTFENVGNQIVPSYQPYAIFMTAVGPSGTTNPQISLSTPDEAVSNLLPGDEVPLTTGVVDIAPGTNVTSLIVVPDQSSSEPYPSWPVQFDGSDSWCSQDQNPSPCQAAYMGVYVESVLLGSQEEYNLPTSSGAFVYEIGSGSPADTAGLQVGDDITNIGGAAVSSPQDLVTVIDGDHPGESVQVTIWRGQQQMVIPVTLGLLPISSG
jgi:hypothetical protein